jgi:hypothetical protein
MPLPRTLPGGRIAARALPKGPAGRPLCRWCELEILARRRRTFCSDYCVHQHRLRTDPGYLRDQVFARDRGRCALCHADTVAIYTALKRARGPARAAALSGTPTTSSPSPKEEASATWTTSVPYASPATAKSPPNSACASAAPPEPDQIGTTKSPLQNSK